MCRRASPHFERACFFSSYDGALRGLIHLLKYQQIKPAAELLGKLLAKTVVQHRDFADEAPLLVVPVPLFRAKTRQRGFNQAELLARVLVKHLSRQSSPAVELHSSNLRRIRATISQTGLTRHQRRANVRGAFALSHPEAVQGRSVLLVDDVFTTGTTLSECAKVLRSAGAEKVWVATVARVFRHGESSVLRRHLMSSVNQDQGREEADIAVAAKLA